MKARRRSDPVVTTCPNDAKSTVYDVAIKKRLPSIDFLKGLSCVMLFYAHIGMVWCGKDWAFLFCCSQVMFDFLGPPTFIVMSCLGTMISQRNQQAKLEKPSVGARKQGLKSMYTFDSLSKTLYLFILAEVLNYINLGNMGSYFFFGMNALLFMAFYHVLTPVFMRIDWKWKLAIVIGLTVMFEPMFLWCYGGLADNGFSIYTYSVWDAPGDIRVLLYYFFFDIRLQPLFSWTIIALLTSIVFGAFSKMFQQGDKEGLVRELAKIRLIGFTCIILAITSSFPFERSVAFLPLTSAAYGHIQFALPLFLIRHTSQYQFYCFGIICLVFNLICKKHVLSNYTFPWEAKLNNFGKMSLTVYIFSFFGFGFSFIDMELLVYAAFFTVFIIVVVNLFWHWDKRLKRFGSFEWVRDQFVSLSKWLLHGTLSVQACVKKDRKPATR